MLLTACSCAKYYATVYNKASTNNIKVKRRVALKHTIAPIALLLVLVTSALAESNRAEANSLPEIPEVLPAPGPDGKIALTAPDGSLKATNLNPYIQLRLNSWIQERGNPIAAVVVAEVATGRIIAMAQGRKPSEWGATTHGALHARFPNASLFKTVVAAAAIEVNGTSPDEPIGLMGGCGQVQPNGVWWTDWPAAKMYRRVGMTLRRAYGLSCNNYFAKTAIDDVGLGTVTEYARKFGFNQPIDADFRVDPSVMTPPLPQKASTATVGRYAAGFGPVGTSAVHTAWQMLALANDGKPRRLLLFEESAIGETRQAIVQESTAQTLRDIMTATVKGGTAGGAFHRGKYRKLRPFVGGKTGTLTGMSPQGLTTLFSGIAPIDGSPEIVVATIVVLEGRWIFKAPMLAAEAVSAYYDTKFQVSELNQRPEIKIARAEKAIKKSQKNRRPKIR